MNRTEPPDTHATLPPRLVEAKRDLTPLWFGLFVLAMLVIIIVAMSRGWV